MARRLAGVVVLSLVTCLSGMSLAPVTASAQPADDEAAFVRDINALRASHGVAPLTVHPSLTVLARNFAPRMAQNGSIFHNPSLANQAPDSWNKLGENVGVGGDEPSLHQAFVNSPGHYRNLVDPDYRYIGVGVIYDCGRMWVVEDFMASNAPLPQVDPPKTALTAKAGMATKYQLALRSMGR